MGLGAFSRPPVVRAPLRIPTRVRGSPEKVMSKTDAAHESAFPLPPESFRFRRQKGTVGASKFPGAPPGRRLARSEFLGGGGWRHGRGKSLQSAFPPIAHQGGEKGGKKEKTENERTNQPAVPHLPCCGTLSCSVGQEGTCGELGRPPGAYLVSALGTARSRPPSSGGCS